VNYGDIFWADLPSANGREQSGRRPAIIFQDTIAFPLPTVLVISLTGQTSALRYAGVLIQPTPLNGLSGPSVALVFQLRALDTTRIGGQIGHLNDPDLAAIQALAKQLMKL
jgi:mRNA interferase MazF